MLLLALSVGAAGPALARRSASAPLPAPMPVEAPAAETPPPEARPEDAPPPLLPPGLELLAGWDSRDVAPLERAKRTRAAARELGIESFDGAALALLAEPAKGDGLERARAAVLLAPRLPVAWMALASASLAGGHWTAALHAAARAALALDDPLDASLWWRASGLLALALTLFGGGLLWLAVSGGFVARRAAHDLGDSLGADLPGFAQAGLLGAAVLAPVALGAGWLGLALGLFGAVFAYARRGGRVVAAFAAAAVLGGAFGGTALAARALAAFGADPVVDAVVAAEQGLASSADRLRLARAADSDPLASAALAAQARREGDLITADARYAALLAEAPGDARLANNAANVRLALRDVDGAIALLEKASKSQPSPVVLFNLSHAYARAIRLDRYRDALARAQALDEDVVTDLTEVQGGRPGGFASDLATPVSTLRARLWSRADGAALAARLRAPFAHGPLGREPGLAALAFALVAVVATFGARRIGRSSRCDRCGTRLCPRCDAAAADATICDGCHRLFNRPETTDPSLRMARLADLRVRATRRARFQLVLTLALPGAAGTLSGRPALALVGALAGVGALVSLAIAPGLVPDPGTVGAAGRVAFAAIGALLIAVHALVAALGWAMRREA